MLQKLQKLWHPIDSFLNGYTMYTVVLGNLVLLAVVAFVLSVLGVLSYAWWQLVLSGLILAAVGYGANELYAWQLKVPVNRESVWITNAILFFVLTPPANLQDVGRLASVCVLAMASKFIFIWNKKHIFNPVAIALVLAMLLGVPIASWWVATPALAPFALVLGVLVVRKIRRFGMVLAFLATASIGLGWSAWQLGSSWTQFAYELYASWPIAFFAGFMLTEPLTTPATKKMRLAYGSLVGFLFGIPFQIGPLFSSPELALVLGNAFSFVLDPRYRVFLQLKKREEIARNTYQFYFSPSRQLEFEPGQYMEWTFPHENSDARGVRRYFTLASSPTEELVQLGIRIPENPSSYKRQLLEMKPGETIVADQVAGDFTLPEDHNQPVVFIAGGIGVTPFRSMIQYAVDTKQQRDITFFYVNRREEDITYRAVFDAAAKSLGITLVYVLTDTEHLPKKWAGETGYITKEMLSRYIVDLKVPTYYLSGPNAMVDAYKAVLQESGVPERAIQTDYFPGF